MADRSPFPLPRRRLFRRSRKRLTALAAALTMAAGLGVAARLAAEPQVRSFRQSFPVAPGAELRLANLAGQVELVAGTGNQVVVEATVHAEASGSAETQRLVQEMRWVQAKDAKGRDEWALAYPIERHHSFFYPQPRAKEESSFWSFFDSSSSSTTYRGERVRIYTGRHSSAPTLYADLRIAVPPASVLALRNVVGRVHGDALAGSLTIDTGNGDIDLASYSGQLRLDTGSGDVMLGVSRGETSIDTGSGDVVVRQLVGNASIDTGSGDVRIERVAAGRLGIHTASGDVTVRDGAASSFSVQTSSGGVRILGVAAEELTAGTSSGDVRVAYSLAHTRRLTARTGSGDITLLAGAGDSFDLTAHQGSGDLSVGYHDAVLRRAAHREKVVGARRGDGRTVIEITTGSGDCVLRPEGSGGGAD
jgi:DUF4097 and DUF4098 domain-containing protein YvlB